MMPVNNTVIELQQRYKVRPTTGSGTVFFNCLSCALQGM
jgi:hypothetical protein